LLSAELTYSPYAVTYYVFVFAFLPVLAHEAACDLLAAYTHSS